jgi:NADH-quinone oxidoreductase subunit G
MSPNLAEGWNGFALLHNAASRVGGLDIGFVPHDGGVCSADQIALPARANSTFCSCSAPTNTTCRPWARQWSSMSAAHGDAGAHRADVILPGATYTEKSATYVNTEGRVQMAARAVFPPGEAKEDWAIIRALSSAIGRPLPFNSLGALRSAIYAEYPHLARIDEIESVPAVSLAGLAQAKVSGASAPLRSLVGDFYLSNPIARASATMGECAALAAGLRQAAE